LRGQFLDGGYGAAVVDGVKMLLGRGFAEVGGTDPVGVDGFIILSSYLWKAVELIGYDYQA